MSVDMIEHIVDEHHIDIDSERMKRVQVGWFYWKISTPEFCFFLPGMDDFVLLVALKSLTRNFGHLAANIFQGSLLMQMSVTVQLQIYLSNFCARSLVKVLQHYSIEGKSTWVQI